MASTINKEIPVSYFYTRYKQRDSKYLFTNKDKNCVPHFACNSCSTSLKNEKDEDIHPLRFRKPGGSLNMIIMKIVISVKDTLLVSIDEIEVI